MADVFVNAGKAITTNLVSGLGGTVPKFMAIGTGSTTATATDTAVETEVETRATCTITRVTTTVTNDTVQNVGTITATTGRAVANAGILDASSSGNLYQHHDFAPVNLNNGDSIQITFKMKYA